MLTRKYCLFVRYIYIYVSLDNSVCLLIVIKSFIFGLPLFLYLPLSWLPACQAFAGLGYRLQGLVGSCWISFHLLQLGLGCTVGCARLVFGGLLCFVLPFRNMSQFIIASIVVSAVSALFCFIGYSTRGWAYETFEITGGACDYTYSYRVGLYEVFIRTEAGIFP